MASACPKICNTDQGAQFTSEAFLTCVEAGRGSVSAWTAGPWTMCSRSVKYEEIYLREYADGAEVWHGLNRYFTFNNTERRHQSLGRCTPTAVHFG